MKYILFVWLGMLLFGVSTAQEKPDPEVFHHPLEVSPNPPQKIKGWTYVADWGEANSSPAQQNEVSVLIGSYPGQIINFPFSGDAVGIAVYAGEEAGMIEFSVDEADWQTLDLFSITSDSKYTLKYFTLESELKGKNHMLQIRVSADNNPNSKAQKCILRYFVVNAN